MGIIAKLTGPGFHRKTLEVEHICEMISARKESNFDLKQLFPLNGKGRKTSRVGNFASSCVYFGKL